MAAEVTSAGWLWRLFAGGELVGSHRVVVDAGAWEWGALRDLNVVVSSMADPGNRLVSESELVTKVGVWTTERVLGVLAAELVYRSPVTVVVEVPAGAEWLLGLPLGVAVVEGRALALRRVSFVGVVAGVGAPVHEPVGDRLRVLAVFSVPSGQALLDVRRERFELQRLMADLAGGQGVAVEFRVLQYGATRRKLQDALEEGEGWDVVHFSGHGTAGQLVLETVEGRPDVVDAADLVEWLEAARDRVKLVSLSSCSSAAFTVSETLRILGVDTDEPVDADADRREVAGSDQLVHTGGVGGSGGLALELVDKVRCAVVAMRYPVVDDFAIDLTTRFYGSLLRAGRAVPGALAAATRDAVKVPATPGAPAVSVATPAVFGELAVDMRIQPPARVGGPMVDDVALRMSGFAPEPDRFVGRTQILARANQTMAPRSGFAGVVLHGMAGAGKTACALELSYGQQTNFQRLVWFECPLEGADGRQVVEAFQRFAIQLDAAWGRDLVGAKLTEADLAAVLADVTEVMERFAVLVVVDNAESLLTATGAWLDPRWGMLLAALTNHRGLGRVVVTTRRTPTQPLPNVAVEAIHALSPHEALLLTRQLPNLNKLLDEPEHHRVLRRVLDTTKGHPKLLELADAHAANPAGLTPFLHTADTTWDTHSAQPEFLARRGDTTPTETVADYLHILDDWTSRTAATLSEPARLLLQILCIVEPDDRTTMMLDDNWADIHSELERDQPDTPLATIIEELTRAALIESHPIGTDEDGTIAYPFGIHPAVANTITTNTPETVITVVRTELAKWWNTIFRQAREAETRGEPTSQLIVRSGRSAATYNIQLQRWATASVSLERALQRTKTPADIADIIPQLETIAEHTAGTDRELIDRNVLASALFEAGHHDQAEQMMREIIDRAVTANDHRIASKVCGDLANLLTSRGRFTEALTVIDNKSEHTRQAGHGPWTQLADHGRRLQILIQIGRHKEVLEQATHLINGLDELPNPPDDNDYAIQPYNLREALHDTAQGAASQQGDWDRALAHVDQIMVSMRERGAPELEQAAALFNGYGPLLRTGRTDDARQLLQSCRTVFERHGHARLLGLSISGIADLEDVLGHLDQAVANEHIALRYKYAARNPAAMASSHHNLANYLSKQADTPAAGIHHRLAAAVITALIGGDLNPGLLAFALDLTDLAPDQIPDYDQIVQQVEQINGVHFAALIDALGGADNTNIDQLIQLAQDIPPEQLYTDEIAQWEPTLTIGVAVAHGNTTLQPQLDTALQPRRDSDHWAQLTTTIDHIVNHPNTTPHLDGLDQIDTAIAERLLDAIHTPSILNPTPDWLQPLTNTISLIAHHHTHPDTPSPEPEVLKTTQQAIDQLEQNDDWANLAQQLRQLTTPDPHIDWSHLDTTDTAILLTTINNIEQSPSSTEFGPNL